MSTTEFKKRRIIIEEDEDSVNNDEEVGSNPDELLSENNSDEDGEDLAENWLEDYAPAPELDYYDPALLGKEDIFESYEKIAEYRRAAEEQLDADRERRQRLDDELEDQFEAANEIEAAELRDRDFDDDDDEVDIAENGGERSINLEAFECPLREWISEDRTRREICRRFRRFLLTYYVGIDEVLKFEKIYGLGKLPTGLRKLPPHYPSKIRYAHSCG